MARGFDYDRAAMVLAECHYAVNDAVVMDKWGVPASTLTRWKKRLLEDRRLVIAYQQRKQDLKNQWQESAKEAIRIGFQRVVQLFPDADLTEMTSFLKMTGELLVGVNFIDATSDSEQATTAETPDAAIVR